MMEFSAYQSRAYYQEVTIAPIELEQGDTGIQKLVYVLAGAQGQMGVTGKVASKLW
jgi:hypothetical protein